MSTTAPVRAKTRLRNFKFNEETYNSLAYLAEQDTCSIASIVNRISKEHADKEKKKRELDEYPWILDEEGRVKKD